MSGSRTTSYVYNNTVYKVHNASGAAWGILAKSWGGTQEATVIAKNNFSADTQTDNSADYDYATSDGATLTQSYNVASDTSASGTGSLNSKSDYSTYFTSIASGSEDFHLTDTAANLWGGSGEDLSGEFTTDLDGDTRSTPWDMGADDFGMRVRQEHYRWRYDNGNEAAAASAAAEDIKIGMAKQVPKRVRVLLSNRTAQDAGTATYQLQVAETANCSSGNYFAVGGSTGDGADWELTDSSYYSDATASTNIGSGLTDPSGDTFVSGQLKDTGDTTSGITLTGGRFTEVEYAIQATANATEGSNYCFRIYDTTGGGPLDTYAVYAQAQVLGVTAVDLLSFEAKGKGEDVEVTWETAQEFKNKGFNLYRAESVSGPWTKLNSTLMPAVSISGEGSSYSYLDEDAIYAKRYYYKLEDVDTRGLRTTHGPICVDWDADGMPDDFEITHGLDPLVDDSAFDNDDDGLSNLDEYKRGTDPNNWDTDGDGIADGDEAKDQINHSTGRTNTMPGVDIIEEDDTGITLELSTSGFDFEEWTAGGQVYERLTIPDYINGHTTVAGSPLLPLKGILIDLPMDKTASLTVLSIERQIHTGYQVYPVPTHALLENGDIREVFFYDQGAYQSDALYPGVIAELASNYFYRDTLKQKVVFYPVAFNPVSGELVLYKRIRIRIDFIDSDMTVAKASTNMKPWSPPAITKGFDTNSQAVAQNHGGQPPGSPQSYAGQFPGFAAGLFGQMPSLALSFFGLTPALWTAPEIGTNYKILVNQEGIYRITRNWLDAKGLTADQIDAIDLSTASIYYLGDSIALNVYDINGNDTLDGGDYIEFYAQPTESASVNTPSTMFTGYARMALLPEWER